MLQPRFQSTYERIVNHFPHVPEERRIGLANAIGMLKEDFGAVVTIGPIEPVGPAS